MPDALLPDEVVEALVAERRPRFVALDGSELASSSSPAQPGHGGVVQLRLSNGIKVGRGGGGEEAEGAKGRALQQPGWLGTRLHACWPVRSAAWAPPEV